MDKKYQVFVSSTYRDLLDERQEVMQALLELDCIPFGMELFPAADDDQWTLIKGLIDDCDYYILIVGGRYGSLHPENGISYTQMEYEYAIEKGIPVISFLPEKPDEITVGKSEGKPEQRTKLNDFKKLVQSKMCKHWNGPVDLGSKVSRSLVQLIKSRPRPGWVKSTEMASIEATHEILELRNRISELEEGEDRGSYLQDLAQGDEIVRMHLEIFFEEGQQLTLMETRSYDYTWNELFALFAKMFSNVALESNLFRVIRYDLESKLSVQDFQHSEATGFGHVFFAIQSDLDKVVLQFRALGLIRKFDVIGSRDRRISWGLTNDGEKLMFRLLAVRRDEKHVIQRDTTRTKSTKIGI